MNLRFVMACGILLGVAASAQDLADRAKLAGAWQSPDSSKAVWTLSTQGDKMQVTKSEGDKVVAELSCELGKECEVKDEGQKLKVTWYFNGPKLIELETRGEDVVKRTFTAGAQKDVLDVEVVPVVPSGQTETQHFTRAAGAVTTAKTGK